MGKINKVKKPAPPKRKAKVVKKAKVKPTQLKAYRAIYDWSGGWGSYIYKELIVIAPSKSKVRSMIIAYHDNTLDKSYWKLECLPMSKAMIIPLVSEEN
jgi:hypothetical protein